MQKNLCALIFAILFIFQLPCGAADNDKARLVQVGIFSLEPINFLDKNNRAKGLYPALIDEIASIENWQIEYVQGNWAQCLENLQSGQIDLLTTVAFSIERARTMDFSTEPVVDIWGQVFAAPDGKIQSILDLNNRKVAVAKRDISGQNFITTTKNFGIECTTVEYDSHDNVFAAIRDGHADAGIAPQHFGLRHAKEYNLVGTSIQFSPFSVFFATKKGNHTHLLNKIDTHLAEWKKDKSSFYYKQLSFWMGGGYEQQMIPKWLWFSFIVAAGLAMLLFFFNRMLKFQVIKKTKALKDSENNYRELVENANTVILRWDTKGNVVFINQFGLELFRFSQDEALGRNVLKIIRPTKKFTQDDLLLMIENICAAPEKFSLIETEHTANNNEQIYIQWSSKAILNDDGTLKEILSVGTDISQRKHLEKHLVDAQKMEAIGTLAGGIAHDFNNILTVIMGNTELAYSNKNDPQKMTINLDRILNATQRAKELTGQILAFSRESDLEKSPLNLADITTEVLNMIRSTLPSTIKIKSRINCKKIILANPTQIHQVILNLCTNAFHAMEDSGGELSVSIQEVSLEEDTLYPDGMNIVAGTYLILQISDTGPGIDPNIFPKIFEPYFTTKKPGKGTGMGLAVAHGIIREHSGHIRAYSDLGKGTDFNIYLPVAKGMNIEKPERNQEKIVGGNEHLMIVDDEKSIIDALCSIVSNFGYTYSGFTNSITALEDFKKRPEQYDLILSDMTMPEMTGIQMSREILRLRPGIPIIICTGHNDMTSRKQALGIGVSEYLQKPLLKNDLLETIRKVLDRRNKNIR